MNGQHDLTQALRRVAAGSSIDRCSYQRLRREGFAVARGARSNLILTEQGKTALEACGDRR